MFHTTSKSGKPVTLLNSRKDDANAWKSKERKKKEKAAKKAAKRN